jgi:hypothetical protein
VARQESKNNELNEKITKLKVYSKCYKHTMASQCKFCHSFYPIEMFIDHIKNCSKDMNNFSRNHFFQMKLDCYVKDTYIMEDPLDHRTYTEYSIQVTFNGEKSWTINQKYKSFCQLHE